MNPKQRRLAAKQKKWAKAVALAADLAADLAVDLAGDFGGRAEPRGRPRGDLLVSPLGDGPAFARGLEAACRDIWRGWRQGRSQGRRKAS